MLSSPAQRHVKNEAAVLRRDETSSIGGGGTELAPLFWLHLISSASVHGRG